MRLDEATFVIAPYAKGHSPELTKAVYQAVKKVSGSRTKFLVGWEMVFQSFTHFRLLDPRDFALDLSGIVGGSASERARVENMDASDAKVDGQASQDDTDLSDLGTDHENGSKGDGAFFAPPTDSLSERMMRSKAKADARSASASASKNVTSEDEDEGESYRDYQSDFRIEFRPIGPNVGKSIMGEINSKWKKRTGSSMMRWSVD